MDEWMGGRGRLRRSAAARLLGSSYAGIVRRPRTLEHRDESRRGEGIGRDDAMSSRPLLQSSTHPFLHPSYWLRDSLGPAGGQGPRRARGVTRQWVIAASGLLVWERWKEERTGCGGSALRLGLTGSQWPHSRLKAWTPNARRAVWSLALQGEVGPPNGWSAVSSSPRPDAGASGRDSKRGRARARSRGVFSASSPVIHSSTHPVLHPRHAPGPRRRMPHAGSNGSTPGANHQAKGASRTTVPRASPSTKSVTPWKPGSA